MAVTATGAEGTSFELELDTRATQWLEEHPARGSLIIAYEVTRCCGGTRLCDVRLRGERRRDRRRRRLLPIGEIAGRGVLIDSRIVASMPPRIPVTVRGMGVFRGLSLDLAGDQWARLLYS